MLLESNPILELKDGIYQDSREPYRDSALSAELVREIERAFSDAPSKGLFELNLSDVLNSSPLTLRGASSQLRQTMASSSVFRFIEGFDLGNVNTVLDLSEDLGGISHFIADQVAKVESVKHDPDLARLACKRCANKHNVLHVSADLSRLSLKDNYYDLIVVGQLEGLELGELETGENKLKQILAKLQASLSANGSLVLSCPNSNRLSKWVNDTSLDSASSLPFRDLYERQDSLQLNRKQLRDSLLDANFAAVDIHASFANANDHKAIFSEDYLTSAVNGVNHFYQLGSISNPDINEYLVFQRLVQDKHNIVDYAQRYIAIAGNSSSYTRKLYDDDFRHYPNQSANASWQLTRKRKRAAHSVIVEPCGEDSSDLIGQAVSDLPFYKGKILIGDWLHALLNKDHRELEQLIQEYDDWLNSDEFAKIDLHGIFDVLPSQLIVNERGGERQFQLIGDARCLKIDQHLLSPEFLLFRALYRLAIENFSLVSNYANSNDIINLELLMIEHMPSVFEAKQLVAHIELAERIEFELNGQQASPSIKEFISRGFDPALRQHAASAEPDAVVDQAQLRLQTASLVNQAARLKALRIDNEHQAQRILDLIQHRADIVEKMLEHAEGMDHHRDNMQAEIDNLHERLHDQHQRNDELHGYLLMRPTTRAKRVARRTMSRITGQPYIENEPEPEPIEEVEESPLPTGELIGQNTEDYSLWVSENTLSESAIEAAKTEIEQMGIKPMFSILVPIYNTDPEYLLPMIESVQNQIYPHWQLCLVDDCSPKSYLKRILEHEALQDPRISIQLNELNQGIAVTTNDALAMAEGDYIALLDHDDEITIDALYENAKVINQTPDAGLIYSDEDKLNMKGQRVEPYFKPDYSPDLLHTNNYICHFTVIKTEIAKEIGGFREGLDGSQDHDIILRAAAASERVVHIPKILYHWRKIPGSTAVEYDSKSYAWEAGRKAVEDQLRKDEADVRVEFGLLKGTYRVFREIIGEPLVSIIIPFKDKPELLESCLNSILNRSSYTNFEIIGVSNNSELPETHERMAQYSARDPRIRFVERNVPFNFSAICNYGVQQANGEYLLLLNNDIEVISPDWIERLLEHAQRDSVGAVGGKLLFPDGTIQHAGVVAGMVGAAGHPHKFFPDNHIGYHGRLQMVYNVSAITGAMLMVKAEKYQQVGGLDEDNLAVAYNDVDFCLKLLDHGYLNVFTPHAKATHHESISRGYEDTDEKLQRLIKEQRHFLDTWSDFLAKGDPFYNPNLSLKNERFSLNFKD